MKLRFFKAALFPLICLLVSAFPLSGRGSTGDSLRISIRQALKEQIVPAGLLTASVILSVGETKYTIRDFFPDTDTRIDDWLRYGPVAQLYLFDLIGVEHRNNVWVQTGNLLIANIITGTLVQVIKETTFLKRPSGGIHSYPSGHTSYAFTGAAILYHEFRDTQPLLACSGYIFAAATGMLRITNDAHWLPDVLAGAGIAIFVTNLVCRIEPLKRWPVIKNKSSLEIIPGISGNGLFVSIRF